MRLPTARHTVGSELCTSASFTLMVSILSSLLNFFLTKCLVYHIHTFLSLFYLPTLLEIYETMNESCMKDLMNVLLWIMLVFLWGMIVLPDLASAGISAKARPAASWSLSDVLSSAACGLLLTAHQMATRGALISPTR